MARSEVIRFFHSQKGLAWKTVLDENLFWYNHYDFKGVTVAAFGTSIDAFHR